MQLKYFKNLLPAVDGMQKVSAVAWSPNGKKFAICTADRVKIFFYLCILYILKVIHLYDDNFEKKDKFQTKASDKVIKHF